MKALTCLPSQLLSNPPELVVVPLYSDAPGTDPEFITSIDEILGYSWTTTLSVQGITPSKAGPVYLIANGGRGVKGVLVVPVPDTDQKTLIDRLADLGSIAETAVKMAQKRGFSTIAIDYRNRRYAVEKELEALIVSAYLSYQEFSLKTKRTATPELTLILSISQMEDRASIRSDVDAALAIAKGCEWARDLVLLPPNLKKPLHLAQSIFEKFSSFPEFTVTLFPRSSLETLGAGGILGVGGAGEPILVKIAYTPPNSKAENAQRIALVGKGVTMDTGGYGIKPADSQVTMKGDCGGAAAVLGTMLALKDLHPAVEVVAYVPLVENLIDSNAMLTGDVLRILNGLTVEILHTDAEGRLILADALSLACRDGASVVIDIATLTGAAVVALGTKYGALFTDDDDLASTLTSASTSAGERFHRLPLDEVYGSDLESPIADLKNIGEGKAGSILAALFLKRFIDKGVHWAHLDIAGGGLEGIKNGTPKGFGVRTLVAFIMSR